MNNDNIEVTQQLYNIIKNCIGKGGLCRLARCSVSTVMYQNGNKNIIYKISLYIGPFISKREVVKFTIRNPVYMCRRDVLNFVVHALSHKKSPYFFNEKTGKFDYVMIPM